MQLFIQPAVTDVMVSTNGSTFNDLCDLLRPLFPSNSQTDLGPVASLGCFWLLVGHITQNWHIFLVDLAN